MNDCTSSTLRCIIIDDELPAHKALEFHIQKIPWLTLNRSFLSAVDALDKIQAWNADIIFLDIDMPDVSGFEMLKITGALDAEIILTTGHPSYAVDGFDFNVSSFLLKPIIFPKFLKAVSIARQKRITHESALHSIISQSITESESSGYNDAQPGLTNPVIPISGDLPGFEPGGMWVKSAKKLIPVEYELIWYLKADSNNTKIMMGKKTITTRMALGNMAGQLPAYFIQTHRSYIVNSRYIKEIYGNMVVMECDDFEVPIAAELRDEVHKKLNNRYGS